MLATLNKFSAMKNKTSHLFGLLKPTFPIKMFFASGSIGRRKALMSVSFSSANAD
jgi:hypothetical protein